MKLQIIFATGNANKVHELREILADPEITIRTMKEAGVSADPDENGTTFEENAKIKAKAVWEKVQAAGSHLYRSPQNPDGFDPSLPIVVASDDSGLVIDALGGAPGIHSARFMGRNTSYSLKMNALLDQLRDTPDEQRTARFVCAVAAIFPEGMNPENYARPKLLTVEGTMEGQIAHSIIGKNGFGYDPFFYLPAYHKTSAQLSDEKKNAISHRGKAFRALAAALRSQL